MDSQMSRYTLKETFEYESAYNNIHLFIVILYRRKTCWFHIVDKALKVKSLSHWMIHQFWQRWECDVKGSALFNSRHFLPKNERKDEKRGMENIGPFKRSWTSNRQILWLQRLFPTHCRSIACMRMLKTLWSSCYCLVYRRFCCCCWLLVANTSRESTLDEQHSRTSRSTTAQSPKDHWHLRNCKYCSRKLH